MLDGEDGDAEPEHLVNERSPMQPRIAGDKEEHDLCSRLEKLLAQRLAERREEALVATPATDRPLAESVNAGIPGNFQSRRYYHQQ